jgi:hypothetical protein
MGKKVQEGVASNATQCGWTCWKLDLELLVVLVVLHGAARV